MDTSTNLALPSGQDLERNGLRQIVAHYASSKVEILVRNCRFREVVAEVGDMGVDLVLALAGK